MAFKIKKRNYSYTRIIVLGFLLIIFLGAALLALPISSRSGEVTNLLDCFFTSASATCVTGLMVYDTYTHWTLFGQIVILCLMQVGGLGFMTVVTLFSLMLGRKISLTERHLMQEASNIMQIGGIVRLTKHVLLGTLIIEGTGALFLSFKFVPILGLGEGIYNSIFHSISAFCNAGIDLMGKYRAFSSLTTLTHDLYIHTVLAVLVVIGGVGFVVWEDFYKNRNHWSKYSLHTKVVCVTTAGLIIVPAVMIFVSEYNASLVSMPLAEKIMMSFFHSISTRTAGFIAVDMSTFHPSTVILTVLLMIIGGSPGSTAGGIKTTTFFILLVSSYAAIRNKSNVGAFRRRFEDGALRKASTVLFSFAAVSFAAIMVLSLIQALPIDKVIYEVFSAISTSGMSLGITPLLNPAAKVIVMVLMFFGRMGILSIALALSRTPAYAPVEYPKEKFVIG